MVVPGQEQREAFLPLEGVQVMFTDMLAVEVKPLSAYEPACQKAQREGRTVKVVKPAHIKRHANSIAAYTKVMGDAWVPTKTIESRLGFARASALGTLREWEELEIVERRKIGGEANWNLRKGYEWRFCPVKEDEQ